MNRDQRHTAYILLYNEIRRDIYNRHGFGFCYAWNSVIGGCLQHIEMGRDLPELYNKKTTDSESPFWFKSKRERINAIIECMEETTPLHHNKKSKP